MIEEDRIRREELVERIFKELDCSEVVTVAFINEILQDIKLFDKKQHDYGSRNISDFGEKGVLVRVNDKLSRLKNLIWGDKDPANESINDSWTDMSVYGVIARLVRNGKWE